MRIRFAPPVAAMMVALALVACNGAGLPSFGATPTPTSTANDQTEQPTETPLAEPTGTAPPGTTASLPPTTDIDFARLATGETPDGWIEVLSRDEHCRQAVPNDWLTDIIVGFGDSPGLQVQSMVADDLVPNWNTWPDYIAALKRFFLGDGQLVLVENDDLFLMRGTTAGGGNFVISRNNHDLTACGIVLTADEAFLDKWAATDIQILYTLALNASGPSLSPSP
jgi:hypothetical protein